MHDRGSPTSKVSSAAEALRCGSRRPRDLDITAWERPAIAEAAPLRHVPKQVEQAVAHDHAGPVGGHMHLDLAAGIDDGVGIR